jgi:hypothetical protein
MTPTSSRPALTSVICANGVTYATIFDVKYPKKLAKAFSLEQERLMEQVFTI